LDSPECTKKRTINAVHTACRIQNPNVIRTAVVEYQSGANLQKNIAKY